MPQRVILPPEEPQTPTAPRRPAGGTTRRRPPRGCDLCPRHCVARRRRARLLLRPRKSRRPHGLHHLRPQHRLLHRSDREEAAVSFLSRHVGAVVRHGRLQPGLQVLPELDHQSNRATSTPPAIRPRPRPSPGPPSSSAAAAWPSPTTTRSCGPSTPSTPPGVPPAGHQDRGRHLGLHAAARPAPRSTNSIDAANVDLKASTTTSIATLTGGHLEPVLDTLRWLVHETDVWLEITNLVIPAGQRFARTRCGGCARWIADRVGARRAAAFLGLPSRLRAARPRPDAAGNPGPSLRHLAPQARLAATFTRATSADRRASATYCPELRPGG